MNFNSILTKFGQDVGIGPVTFDDRDSCYLRFNQHSIVIEQAPQDQSLFIYTCFPETKNIPKEQYYQHLLSGNHFGRGTGSAWFSFNPETSEVFLTTRIGSSQLEYDEFVIAIEQFLFSIDQAKIFIDSIHEQKHDFPDNAHIKNPFA